jgi:hypothetical protein
MTSGFYIDRDQLTGDLLPKWTMDHNGKWVKHLYVLEKTEKGLTDRPVEPQAPEEAGNEQARGYSRGCVG